MGLLEGVESGGLLNTKMRMMMRIAMMMREMMTMRMMMVVIILYENVEENDN